MSSTTDTEQRFAYLLSPEFEIVNTAGKPLTGGWIEVYIHGTRDKYYCLSDFDGTLHPFQIPLDSLGSNIVLASPTHAYDIYIYNKFGSLVMSRYNVVPATNSPDAVADVVVIDSPDETINVTIDGGSNWHLEVNTDLIATASGLAAVSGDLQDQIDGKKDIQQPYSASGTVTQTITKIEQNENGEIEVTYANIELPPEVPNINIISPSGTIDVTSNTDPTTNTKTFKIDVHNNYMQHFIGYYGQTRYEDRQPGTTEAYYLNVNSWSNYEYEGDFIYNNWQGDNNPWFYVNPGLYMVHAVVHYAMASGSLVNEDKYIKVATGQHNGWEDGTRYKDFSQEAQLTDNSITVNFIRKVDEHNGGIEIAPYLPYGVSYAFIHEIQIVKLDSIAYPGGGSGRSYAPGYGIEIPDYTIQIDPSVVVTHNYFTTAINQIQEEINNIETTITNVTGDLITREEFNVVTGDISNINEAITNIIGATGDYATKDYVDEAVSGLENYSAGQYISIEDHVINVTGVQPAGDYATNADLQTVSAAIPESEEVEFEELDLAQFAQASAVTVIQNQITNVTGDIYNINEDITNLIGATGDYATEEYVNEAIAAVTGQPFEQQQSDWTQTDDTKVDYIKHKPRQVNLVAGDNITIEQDGLDVIISAEDPGDTYSAGQYISIQNGTIAATGLQPAGNYLTPADLNGYATEQYVDEAVAAVTGQPVSQVNSDWLATSGVAEILNKPDVFQLIAGDNIDITPSGNDLVISASSDVTKAYVDEQIDAVSAAIPTLPQEEEVEFEEIDLNDYALASSIPDVSNFATNDDVQYVQEQVDQLVAATGYYLQASDLQGYATEQELQAVDAKVDAVSAAIPTLPQEEEVEFEELNLSDYALASAIPDISNLATKAELAAVEAEMPVVTGFATKTEVDAVSGKLPTTDLGKFTIHSNVSGGPIDVLVPTDQAPDAVFYQINSVSGYAYASAPARAVINYYYGETPADFNGSDDYILFTIDDNISNIGAICFYYTTAETGMGGPSVSTSSISGGSTGVLQSGSYKVKAQCNHAGTSSPYGKYLQIMFNWKNYASNPEQSIQWAQEALSKITFFGVVRPDPTLGTIVNLDRYYLGGNVVSNKPTNSGLPAQIWLNPDTKKQEVYLPQSVPSSWNLYGNNFYSYTSTPTAINGGSVSNFIAYKYDSATSKYIYARMISSIYDSTNNIKKAEFVTLEPVSGNFEKWTYDYSDYSNRHWTTETISPDMSEYIPYSASGVSLPNSKFEIDTEGQAYKVISEASESDYGSGAYSWSDGALYFHPPYAQVGTYTATFPSNTDHLLVSQSGGIGFTYTFDSTTHTAAFNISALPNRAYAYVWAKDSNDDWVNIGPGNTPVKYIVPAVTEEYLTDGDLELNVDNQVTAIDGHALAAGDVTIADLAAVSGNLEADIQTVSAAIPVLPSEEEVEFEELDLSDYALASAIPSLDGYATEAYVDAAITGIDVSDIFWAVIDSTTYAEIQAAKQAGKKVFVVNRYGGSIFVPTYSNGWVNADFGNPLHSEGGFPHLTRVWVDSSDVWHSELFIIPYRGTNGIVVDGGTISVTGQFEQVNSDWNATSGVAEILNKPEIVEYDLAEISAGEGISIVSGANGITISASGGSAYTAGVGIDITNDVISVDNTVASKNDIPGVSRGKGIDINTSIVEGRVVHTYSVDDTVITTAATAVNLSKANFEIDNNGQAYKLSNSTDQVTYTITSASEGGTFDGTIKLNVGDTITITNFPVTDEQMSVRLDVRDGLNVASYSGPVTAGSDITLTVERDTDLTSTFDIQVLSFTDFQTYSLTDSDCTFDNIVTSREEYVLESEIPVVTGFATKTELATVEAEIPTLPTEEEVTFKELDLSEYALASAIPDVSDMATKTWVGQQGYLTSVPATYVTDSELNSAVSGLATKSEVGNKQDTLTGITDVQVVNALPAEPVATVLYLIPEA